MLEGVLGGAVVEDALSFDHLVLLRIEGGGVVLEVLNQRAGLGALVEDLRLALVDAAAAAHRDVPWLEKIHSAVAFVSGSAARGRAVRLTQMARSARPLP